MTLGLVREDPGKDRDPATLVRAATLRPTVNPDALVRYLAALPAPKRAMAVLEFSEPRPAEEFAAALDEELRFILGEKGMARFNAMFETLDFDAFFDLVRENGQPREPYKLRVLRQAIEPHPIKFHRRT